jgi:hypothetical protein
MGEWEATKIKFRSAGFAKVMRSTGVRDDLVRRGEAIRDTAGDGFEVVLTRRSDRWAVSVRTSDYQSRLAEARDSALTAAIGAGHG